MHVVLNRVVRKHLAKAVLGEVMEQIPWIPGGKGHQCKGPEAGAALAWWRTRKEADVARWMIGEGPVASVRPSALTQSSLRVTAAAMLRTD